MTRPHRARIIFFTTSCVMWNAESRFVRMHVRPRLRLHADEEVVLGDAGVVDEDVDRLLSRSAP